MNSGFERQSGEAPEHLKTPYSGRKPLEGTQTRGRTWTQGIHVDRFAEVKSIPEQSDSPNPLKDTGGYSKVIESYRNTLKGAYHSGTDIVVVWQRQRTGGDIGVVVGGNTLVGGEAGQNNRTLYYPAGGQGRSVEVGQLESSLSHYRYWTKVSARPDWLNAPERQALPPTLADMVEYSSEPFAVAVRGRPIPPNQVKALSVEKSQELRQAKAYAENSERLADKAKQLEGEYK